MQVPLSSITVDQRVRKDIGDLTPLMQSMQAYGQLSPIVLTRQNALIAGHRRLLAAKKLGWYTVEAVYVDRDSDLERLEMELQENVHRKDFSPEELVEGYSRLEKLKKPRLSTRIADFVKRVWTRLFRWRKGRGAGPAAQGQPAEPPRTTGKGSPDMALDDAAYDFRDSEFTV